MVNKKNKVKFFYYYDKKLINIEIKNLKDKLNYFNSYEIKDFFYLINNKTNNSKKYFLYLNKEEIYINLEEQVNLMQNEIKYFKNIIKSFIDIFLYLEDYNNKEYRVYIKNIKFILEQIKKMKNTNYSKKKKSYYYNIKDIEYLYSLNYTELYYAFRCNIVINYYNRQLFYIFKLQQEVIISLVNTIDKLIFYENSKYYYTKINKKNIRIGRVSNNKYTRTYFKLSILQSFLRELKDFRNSNYPHFNEEWWHIKISVFIFFIFIGTVLLIFIINVIRDKSYLWIPRLIKHLLF